MIQNIIIGIKLNFQDRLTGVRKKSRIIYCKNRLCDVNKFPSKKHNERTLKSIICLITDQEKDIEKQLFYVCSECAYYDFSNFGRPLTSENLNLKTYIIPDSFEELYSKMLKPQGSQKCLFCNLENIVSSHLELFYKSEIETKKRELKLHISDNERKELEKQISKLQKTERPIYEIKPCIYKLFTKEPAKRRNYIGYLCLACKAVYYDSNFKEIDWKRISEQYKQDFEDETINLFAVWNKIYQQKLQKMKEYKKLKEKENLLENKEEIKHFELKYAITKQELETWQSLKIKKPPKKQEEISIKYLGPRYTSSGFDIKRPERFSLTLENLTLRKFMHAINDYGSDQQKEELRQFGYL